MLQNNVIIFNNTITYMQTFGPYLRRRNENVSDIKATQAY